jgi:hypothetical protein
VAPDGSLQGGMTVLSDDNPANASTDFPVGTTGISSFGVQFVLLAVVVDPAQGPQKVWFPMSPLAFYGQYAIAFESLADGASAQWGPLYDYPPFRYRLAGVLTKGTNDASAFTIEIGASTVATVSTNVGADVGVTLSGAAGVDLDTEITNGAPLKVTWNAAAGADSPSLLVMLAPAASVNGVTPSP